MSVINIVYGTCLFLSVNGLVKLRDRLKAFTLFMLKLPSRRYLQDLCTCLWRCVSFSADILPGFFRQ